MKSTPLKACFLLIGIVLLLPASVFSQLPEPAVVPGALPEWKRQDLNRQRVALEARRVGLEKQVREHNERCTRVPAKDREWVAECRRARDRLQKQIQAYLRDLKAFDAAIGPPMPMVDPKQIATEEACRRNLAYRSVLVVGLERLEKTAEDLHKRHVGIGQFHDAERSLRNAIIWDSVADSVNALGPFLGWLKDGKKISPDQWQRLMAVRDNLTAAFASARSARNEPQEVDKMMDAANGLKSTLMRSGLAPFIGDQGVQALIRMVDIIVAAVKMAIHGTVDPKWSRDFSHQVDDVIDLAGAAYPAVAVGKGVVTVGTAGWYFWATRGNMEALREAFSQGAEFEMLLDRRIEALREKLAVYDRDLALCGDPD
jgi:hypothetical protein